MRLPADDCFFICCSGVANAQFGLNLFGSGKPPAAPGAGRSFADVVCADQDLTTLCGLIRTAANNPTVAELTDPTFTGRQYKHPERVCIFEKVICFNRRSAQF